MAGKLRIQILDENNVTVFSGLATPKVFSSGSTGFYAGGKADLDDGPYQVSLNVTKHHSKPAASTKLATKKVVK